MKHTPTVAEDSKNSDVDGHVIHVAEEHSFEPTERTALTAGGECPHCGSETYNINPRRLGGYWILSGAAVFALLQVGLGNIAVMTFFIGLFLTTIASDFTETAHRALSRVGL